MPKPSPLLAPSTKARLPLNPIFMPPFLLFAWRTTALASIRAIRNSISAIVSGESFAAGLRSVSWAMMPRFFSTYLRTAGPEPRLQSKPANERQMPVEMVDAPRRALPAREAATAQNQHLPDRRSPS